MKKIILILGIILFASFVSAAFPHESWDHWGGETLNGTNLTTSSFGDPIAIVPGLIGNAIKLERGDGQYLTNTSVKDSDGFGTMEMWINPASISTHDLFTLGEDDTNYLRIQYWEDRVFYVTLYDENSRMWQIASTTTLGTGWSHIIINFPTGDGKLAEIYINGSLEDTSAGDTDPDAELEANQPIMYIGVYFAGANYYNGIIEGLRFSYPRYNCTGGGNDCNLSYNSGAGYDFSAAPPAAEPSAPTFVAPTPADGATNNTNQTINMSCCIDCNYYLWINSSTLTWDVMLDNDTFSNWTMNVSVDDTYNYIGGCINRSDGLISSNSSTRTFTLDTTTPTITINEKNFFNSSNISTTNQYGDSIFFNITAADNDNVFAFLVNITKDGITYFNETNTSINVITFNYTKTVDISSFPEGIYDIEVSVADGHHYTGGYKIGDYEISKLPNKITFDTTENNRISVSSDGAIATGYTREINSYGFSFNYLFPTTTRKFIIESQDGKIYHIPLSNYKAHFVIWNGKHGNWIDFKGIEGKYTVKKINDYKYEITFYDMPIGNKVIAKSIGGLNVRTEYYKWYRGSYELTAPEVKSLSTAVISLNITKDNSYIDKINATLTYNNTKYTVSKTDFTTYVLFNKTIIAPDVATDIEINYSWNVTINQSSGSIYNFSIDGNQSVVNWGLDNCTLYSTPALNFTFKDEINNSKIRANIDGTFNYTIDRITYETFTLDLTNVNNFSICIKPSNATLYTTYTLYYSKPDDYPERRYYVSEDALTSATVLRTLYLLYVGDGMYGRFRVVDKYENPLSIVSISMKKAGIIMEQEYTDDSGLATFWVNPDDNYDFTFTKTGYVSATYNLRLTTSEIYTITLEAEEEAEVSSYSRGIVYSFSPYDDMLTNNTLYNFTFNLNSSFWTVTGCTSYLKNSSGDILSQSTSDYSVYWCDISIEYDTGNLTTIFDEVIVEYNNSVNITYSAQHNIKHTYEGQFSLKNFLDDLKAFAGAGFNDFTRMFLAFIVIFSIVAYASSGAIGLREPEALIALTWVLVVFFSYIGWMTINYNAIPTEFMKKYIIAILITLGSAAYIIKRHTE